VIVTSACNRYAVGATIRIGTHRFLLSQPIRCLATPRTIPRGARRAIAHLTAADPVLGEVIRRVGQFRLSPRVEGTHFDAVCRSIIYQQLSGKAAATIHGRVMDLYGGRSPLPQELAATPDEQLRRVGLSRQKLSYLKDLATRVASNEVPIEALHELADDDVIDALVRVKGVGRWTAQMFLMFRLGRPDVLPELDLGIQKAIQRAYRLRKRPLPERVLKIGAAWAPYRTVASWYLWRSLELAE
jgi:3-methyladenine DNA glycosylase/8-oxoguanine DNA glycosylase